MRNAMEGDLDLPQADSLPNCGRPDCICALPLGERFLLWALRQWQCELTGWQYERSLPPEGSALVDGFRTAGLLDTLSDFAALMDVLLFGTRRALEIHAPTCARQGSDEMILIALCALAQDGRDGPLRASLDTMMVPPAASAAAQRFKTFARALSEAGLNLPRPAARRRLN
jgi:hypothetical protein